MKSLRKLYQGDCLEILPKLKAGSIDMVFADLPYGITACKWDAVIPFDPLWKALERVCKPNAALVFTASQPFTSALIMSKPDWFKHDWVWDKKTARGHLVAKKRPMAQHESVLVFCVNGKSPIYNPIMIDRPPEKYKVSRECARTEIMGGKKTKEKDGFRKQWYPKTIQSFSNASPKGRLHPTQKPVELVEYMIRTYTNEGQTVLDPVMGSGTTGVACKNLGRCFVGIELDQNYFQSAKDRIKEAE